LVGFFIVVMLVGCLLIFFSARAMRMGVFLLVYCFFVLFILCLLNRLWYGFLFFIMYVGGLLVLFFYVIALNSNVGSLWVGKLQKFYLLLRLVGGVGCIGFFSVGVVDVVSYEVVEECSYLVFRTRGVCIVFIVSVILLMTIFLVGCLTSFLGGGVRLVG
jgi:hypothetical protein